MTCQEPQPPRSALLPINRCNLPACVIASLEYQRHPAPLYIDSVATLYADLWAQLAQCINSHERLSCFRNYMTLKFRLPADDLPDSPLSEPQLRPKAHYNRMIRGWLFDSDSREGAVWKGWVESRFGLLTRFHKTAIAGPESEAYLQFMETRARGIHNTNALETQLDLLYSFCQIELRERYPQHRHLRLYRGSRGPMFAEQHGRAFKLFNNLSSFTLDPEEALRFGDTVLETAVPLSKIVCFDSLLPGQLQGEQEYMVLGGLFEVAHYRGITGH
ncbi:NAD(+)--dinitrogen-reductase ADP-D-ribosyltransferase [Marinobacterium lacunae]|uniref:NAD(+)--dinitrogen-reductase ADP-D-ribosyltransferase n=1 Tax=Marinobacterium lacunae TaxID=1232683 RepID=A0A081G1Q6_9GAMM|nr:NAD(+)--dinitrogen-reductase ADP-D-ribosyltransferase [Marinobacterium lacunae]KEA64711.1 NAD(+)--dinitrogen-reductase ADP-D-ribosyltransferase [Marinobacterium lacunae]MBR9883923.1 NAD(+)--dinitrogen-reductase ADP-D-ribosyltransferase [Oceanospirillales bacterium]